MFTVKVSFILLTFFDDQVGHDEGHGMAGVDVISTVNMFAIDGQSHSREEFKDTLENYHKSDMVWLGCTHIIIVRFGQHRNVHGNSPIVVVNADQ